MAHDGQAQAETAVPPGRRAVGLLESSKNVRQKFRPDPLAGVAYGDSSISAFRFQPRLDVPAAGRVFDGIGEQIPNDLLQAAGISRDRPPCGTEDESQVYSLRLSRRAHSLQGSLDHRTEINGIQFETQFARHNA